MSRQGTSFNETAQGQKQPEKRPPIPASTRGTAPDPLGVSLLLETSQKTPNNTKIFDLLNRGASMEETNAQGATPLIVAVRSGQENLADMFIQRGANVDATDHEGNTPLILAVMAGSVKNVRDLTDKGAKLDHFNNLDRSALMWAAALGRREIAQILMRKGAELHLKNSAGETAYDIAKQSDNHSLAAVLKAGVEQQKTPAITRPSSAMTRAVQYKELMGKT